MTSAINFTNIDENFPIAGQDNDSQGFRDNFTYIKSGLTNAKSEISDLQANVLLSGILGGDEGTVENNLRGSVITNGSYFSFFGRSRSVTTTFPFPTTLDTDIDVSLYSIHAIVVQSTPITFVFRNWPTSLDSYSSVRVHVRTISSIEDTYITFATENGNLVPSMDMVDQAFNDNVDPGVIMIPTGDDLHRVFEAWTYDNGLTVFIRSLGQF